ncbi:hypothetical protein C6376_16350 [Streptomyces sp. P3]|nr:hypothetical protein C6376_16350 [Streptomyces sp. P3]
MGGRASVTTVTSHASASSASGAASRSRRLARQASPSAARGDGRSEPPAGTCGPADRWADGPQGRFPRTRAGHPGRRRRVPRHCAGPPLGLGGLPFEVTEIELPEGSIRAPARPDGRRQASHRAPGVGPLSPVAEDPPGRREGHSPLGPGVEAAG